MKKRFVFLIMGMVGTMVLAAQTPSVIFEKMKALRQKERAVTGSAPKLAEGSRSGLTFAPMVIDFNGNVVVSNPQRVWENPSDSVVEFYFTGPELFLTKQDLYAYFRNRLGDPYDTARSQQELADSVYPDWIKSPMWQNNVVVGYSADSVSYSRQCDPILSRYGVYTTNCGIFVDMFIAISVDMGYFQPWQLRRVGIEGHAKLEVWLQGGWAERDVDPDQLSLKQPNPSNANGEMTSWDAYNDTSLIKEVYTWRGHTLAQADWETLENYKAFIRNAGAPNYYGDGFKGINENITGVFKMPPHSKIVDRAPYAMVYVDQDYPGVDSWISELDSFMTEVENQACDSLCQVAEIARLITELSSFFPGMTAEQLIATLDTASMTLYRSSADQGLPLEAPYYATEQGLPMWKIILDAHSDTVHLGRDLQGPVIILKTYQAMNLADTSVAGPTEFTVWSKDNSTFPLRPAIINPLQKGSLPPSSGDTLDVSINENVFPITGEWHAEGTNLDLLEITRNGFSIVSYKVSSIGKTAYDGTVLVFPNPASGLVTCAQEECSITSASGQHIASLRKREQVSLSKGLYIAVSGNSRQKLVVY